MGVGIGLTGFLGLGKESSYGVAVARTNFFEISSEDITVEEPKIESSALAQVGIRNTKVAQGGISVAGNFSFDASYGGWERLLRQAMGQVVSSRPDVTNNPTVWDHTFTIADYLPTGLTFEVFRGTENFVTEPNKSFLYTGCVISSLNLSCSTDDLLKLSATILGQDASRASKSTPTYDQSPLAVYHQGTLKWNNNDVEAHTFSLDIANQLETRPKLGSRYTRQPVRSGKLSVSGTFQAEFVSWSEYDDFRANTDRQVTFNFVGDTITGAYTYLLSITLAITKITNYRVVLQQPGRIVVEVGFKAYRTDSAGEISITMRNITTSSLTD